MLPPGNIHDKFHGFILFQRYLDVEKGIIFVLLVNDTLYEGVIIIFLIDHL